jgi:hypothetical protein
MRGYEKVSQDGKIWCVKESLLSQSPFYGSPVLPAGPYAAVGSATDLLCLLQTHSMISTNVEANVESGARCKSMFYGTAGTSSHLSGKGCHK